MIYRLGLLATAALGVTVSAHADCLDTYTRYIDLTESDQQAKYLIDPIEVLSSSSECPQVTDAKSIADAIVQAQAGDGIDLRALAEKVNQTKEGTAATEAQVAAALISANNAMTFCVDGKIETQIQVAELIATQLN